MPTQRSNLVKPKDLANCDLHKLPWGEKRARGG